MVPDRPIPAEKLLPEPLDELIEENTAGEADAAVEPLAEEEIDRRLDAARSASKTTDCSTCRPEKEEGGGH